MVEADISDRHVDIVEVRPPWDGAGEHTRFPIARLRYTKSTGPWAIYWRDRNLQFHEYKRKRPTKTQLRPLRGPAVRNASPINATMIPKPDATRRRRARGI